MKKSKKISPNKKLKLSDVILWIILSILIAAASYGVYYRLSPQWQYEHGVEVFSQADRDKLAAGSQESSGQGKSEKHDEKGDPSLPKVIYIEKTAIKGELVQVGVNADLSLQAPVDIYKGGWYQDSAKPGEDGAMVIDGHASANNGGIGLFGKLYQLNVGDSLYVERADGALFKYKIADKENVHRNKVDMQKVLKPFKGADQGLNLITCSGSWVESGRTLENRLIIYAIPA